ncbi:PREDICTED: uncharacterized protein LOC105563382 [Vollenhovia emeryi]|uniref:uncharacterized protein LOC105563382 n=1 Tax=Vollenhovia emeryi TaxID=411798 RepID=UPI0005F52A0B|nr:PREDICTED: uncharacterized protein LOC105563382 [Vollenhovia emeryi]
MSSPCDVVEYRRVLSCTKFFSQIRWQNGRSFHNCCHNYKKSTTTKVKYSYVPHQWVKNGFVFWSPKNCLTLRNDPSSAPEPEWKKFKCKIKKDFIVGKEEAELWEEEYLNASCTESEENLSINRQLISIRDTINF